MPAALSDRFPVRTAREVGDAVAIRLERLAKSYGGHRALEDVTLEVCRGEVFGYLGPNGAGKTTTLRILLGLLRPTAGRASVLGLDAWAHSTLVRRRVGYVAGDMALYDRMTARELLEFLGHLRGEVDPAEVDRLARRLDVDLDRRLRTLSKGNRQKVAIVQALMGRPDVLLLDEPTSGLDPLVQQQVHELLRDHARNGGAVVLSSHVLPEVQAVADRVGIIRAGRLVAVERLDDLRAKSLHRVQVRFAEPVAAAEFALAGVRAVVVRTDTLSCQATQTALDALLKVVARHEVVDLSCEEASLEETFLAYYDGGGVDAA